MSVFVIPKDYNVVFSCPDCRNRLSATSARKLKHALMRVAKYEVGHAQELLQLVGRLDEIPRFTARPSNLEVVAAVEVDIVAAELRVEIKERA